MRKILYTFGVNLGIIPSLIMNILYVLFLSHKWKKAWNQTVLFERMVKSNAPEDRKDGCLRELYSYRKDQLNGALDWKWMHPFVAALDNFSRDCDDFSALAHFMYGDGKTYAIITPGWKENHMVYARENKVYSSGFVRQMPMDEYLERYYGDMKITVVRQYF